MREDTAELIEQAKRVALASVYVNHPSAAYKHMRLLAEHTMNLCDHVEMYAQEDDELTKCKEFLRVTARTLIDERGVRRGAE